VALIDVNRGFRGVKNEIGRRRWRAVTASSRAMHLVGLVALLIHALASRLLSNGNPSALFVPRCQRRVYAEGATTTCCHNARRFCAARKKLFYVKIAEIKHPLMRNANIKCH
jgi:hypothetical protein